MSTFTLSDLRALIDTAARKSGRTVEDIKIGLIPGAVRELLDPPDDDPLLLLIANGLWKGSPVDAGHTLIPLLALCHGLDPGRGGRAVAWRPLRVGERRFGWWLSGDDEAVYYGTADDGTADDDEIVDDTIATEPDDLAALVMACKLALQ